MHAWSWRTYSRASDRHWASTSATGAGPKITRSSFFIPGRHSDSAGFSSRLTCDQHSRLVAMLVAPSPRGRYHLLFTMGLRFGPLATRTKNRRVMKDCYVNAFDPLESFVSARSTAVKLSPDEKPCGVMSACSSVNPLPKFLSSTCTHRPACILEILCKSFCISAYLSEVIAESERPTDKQEASVAKLTGGPREVMITWSLTQVRSVIHGTTGTKGHRRLMHMMNESARMQTAEEHPGVGRLSIITLDIGPAVSDHTPHLETTKVNFVKQKMLRTVNLKRKETRKLGGKSCSI